eukprot:c40872_g1_i1 orf=3-164(-)
MQHIRGATKRQSRTKTLFRGSFRFSFFPPRKRGKSICDKQTFVNSRECDIRSFE